MRFLMLNWRDPENPLSGGAERVSVAYMTELVRRGHEVCWFANDFPGAAREQVIDGIQYIRGGGKGSSVLKAIQWYRRQKPFDLVIDQHHGIPWYAPWWCGTNCVAYIHEVLGPIWNTFYPWPLSAAGRAQERWTHWFYRRTPFWTPSESTRVSLTQNGVRDVKVIPNGCDTTPLAALPPKPPQLPLQLISVSRLAPNKRIDHSLRATKLLNDQGIETFLTVVGTGETEQRLKQLAVELGLTAKVRFTGSLAEEKKNEELRKAHFLIHCSVREGWGLNVLEANAMGTPAIVYPVGGLVDSTVHNETGMITTAETPEAVADAVSGVLKQAKTYDRLRAGAWERSKQFQWNVVLPQACNWLESQSRRRS
ncbi:MAG: glycosyltransferase [Akkermansiaceae bacterium]|nr:glycosyltransferase [Verrucomicrobiales bacterium]